MSLNPTSSHGGSVAAPLTLTGTSDVVQLTLKAVAGQSFDILEVFDGANSQVVTIDNTGELIVGGTTLQPNGRVTLSTSGGLEPLHIQASAGSNLMTAVDHTNRTVFQVLEAGGVLTRQGLTGALATTTFVSGTGKQIDTASDRDLVVPFTGDASNNAATLLIQLSPDNVTYSTLDTLSIAAALNLTGALNVPVAFSVPAGWYVKLTATHGTIGTATYY